MIRTVIFDIDNTLYCFDAAHAKAMEALSRYAETAFGWSGEELRRRALSMQKALRNRMGDVSAIHSRLIRFQNMLEAEGLPLHPHALRMYEAYWETLLKSMEPSPGVEEVLRELKRRGITVGAGTDMTALMQFRKLTDLNLLPWFDFIVTSEEAVAEKPSPGLFSLCAKKAGCAPEACLFVGDNPSKDIAGALRAGMRAVLFTAYTKRAPESAPLPEGCLVTDSLRDILSLPGLDPDPGRPA